VLLCFLMDIVFSYVGLVVIKPVANGLAMRMPNRHKLRNNFLLFIFSPFTEAFTLEFFIYFKKEEILDPFLLSTHGISLNLSSKPS